MVRQHGHPRLSYVAIALFAAGLLMTSDGLYIWSKAAFGQVLLDRSWHRTLVASTPDKPWSWADIQPVAKLTIPRLDRSAIVLDGTHGEALAWGPGHMPETPLPGEPGLSIIAGHRDTHFAVLGELVTGDQLTVQRYDGQTVTYEVIAKRIVDAHQPNLRASPGDALLALVTCWPLDAVQAGGDERLVVLARLITTLVIETPTSSL